MNLRSLLRLLVVAVLTLLSQSVIAQSPVIGPQIRLDPGIAANRKALEYSAVAYEHSVVILWRKWPEEAGNQRWTFGRAYSADAGTTWVSDELHGPNGQGTQEVDPQTAVDPRTGNIWTGGLTRNADTLFVQRRAFRAADWETAVNIISGMGEKQWMAAGRRPDDADSTRIYMSVVGTGVNGVVWSDALGDDSTWSSPLSPGLTFGLLMPRIGASGELYIAGRPSAGDFLRLARSFDLDGVTMAPNFDFSQHPISDIATNTESNVSTNVPGSFSVVNLPIIAVDPTQSKRVYCTYVRSGNGGASGNVDVDVFIRKTEDASAQTIIWENEIQLSIPGDQIFPWIECDSSGRVHMIIMDSRNNPDQLDNDPNNGLFDMYYAYSTDLGQTWNHHRLTTNSFDVLGETFFHDYIGLAVAGNRVYPVYADIAGDQGNTRPEAFTNCIVFGEDAARTDFTVVEEELVSGGLPELAASDDQRLIVRDNVSLIGTTLHTELIVGFDSATTTPKDIDLRIECNASRSNTTGRVSLKDWVTNTWYSIGVYSASIGTDSEVWFRGIYADNPPGLPQPDFDFVRDSDGRIEVRLEHETNTVGSQLPLDSRYDYVQAIVVSE